MEARNSSSSNNKNNNHNNNLYGCSVVVAKSRHMLCFGVVLVSLVFHLLTYHHSVLNVKLFMHDEDKVATQTSSSSSFARSSLRYQEQELDDAASLDAMSNATVANFDWNQVDLTNKANCGMVKCFFPSTTTTTTTTTTSSSSNVSLSNNVGYLIASQRQYIKMRRASQLAQWMTRELQAKHFYMQDAMLVSVTPEQMQLLNDLVDQPLRIISNKTTKSIYNETETMVTIQKVQKAPSPALTFGSSATKVESLPKVLPTFVPYVPNVTALARQLQHERHVIWQALQAVSTLWRDFQGMIDVYGNFYFIDLDGHFSQKTVTEQRRQHLIQNRMERFDHLVEQLLGLAGAANQSTTRAGSSAN